MAVSVPVKANTKGSREFKGKSLVEFIDDYVVIDIETTGLDPRYDEIIEIGAARVAGGVICERFASLCRPTYEVDDFITQLTGITNDMLEDAPSVETALYEFLRFTGDAVLVGYNVNFDINFLYDTCLRTLGAVLDNSFVDVLRVCRLTVKGLPNYKLSTLAEIFETAHADAHRAMGDCMVTHACYERLKTLALGTESDAELSRLKSLALTIYTEAALSPFGYETAKAKDVQATTQEFDEAHPLFQKVCVFTGTLERMSRKQAMQIVVDAGGVCGDYITMSTDYLILGNFDYCRNVKEGKSNKVKQAENYILKGNALQIISETVFYDMLEG